MTSTNDSKTLFQKERAEFLKRKGFQLSEVAVKSFTIGVWNNPAYIAWSTLRMQVEFCQEAMKNFKSQIGDDQKSAQTLKEIKENALTMKKSKISRKSSEKLNLK